VLTGCTGGGDGSVERSRLTGDGEEATLTNWPLIVLVVKIATNRTWRITRSSVRARPGRDDPPNVKRNILGLAAVFGALGLALALAGCGGGSDAAKAKDVLARAQLAEKNVVSQSYLMQLSIADNANSATIAIQGGGYEKGPLAGDQYFSINATGLPAEQGSSSTPLSVDFVKKGATVTVQVGGNRTTIPAEQATSQPSGQVASQLAGLDLARYVTSVQVKDGETLNGELVTKLVGVLDTAALVNGVGRLSSLSSNPDLPSDLVSTLQNLGSHLGSTRAVLYVSDRSGLVMSALIDLAIKPEPGASGPLSLELSYARTGVNQPVAFPQL
jgi:hypothetical protein